MQELYALEKALNIKMLPDMARDSKNLTKFTEKEQYDYDIVNCFYNKKQGKKIFEEMQDINPDQYDFDIIKARIKM